MVRGSINLITGGWSGGERCTHVGGACRWAAMAAM